ncbi:hypothetical protein [Enterobacter kobei]|uniref:hypothetical protein n=1 Tax=Enterobacter kobei TaxID=208224 RepID=UPI0020210672|nr:hypothetical protein [Enterobacter kobei]URE93634.1 hypothetical protein LK774_14090 [Enterobacter kobei]
MAIDVLDVIGLRLFKQQIEFEEDDRDELITLYAQAEVVKIPGYEPDYRLYRATLDFKVTP